MTDHTAKANPLKHVRLRFIVLIPLIIACALISRAHVLAVGGTHELIVDDFVGIELTEESLTFTPDDMVTVSSMWMDDEGLTHIMLEANNPGSGMVIIGIEGSGTSFQVECTADGVVVVYGVDFTGWEYVFASIVLFIVCVGILCLSAFVTLWRRAWFGYEMAAYAGGAIFFIVQALSIAFFYFTGQIVSFGTMAMVVTQMTNTFVNGAMLPVALISLLISFSNAVLLRREGVGFTNMLGVASTLGWGLVFLGIWFFRNYISNWIANIYLLLFLDSALSGIVAYAIALFLGTCITALLAAYHTPSFPRDYLIILGSGLRPDGTPTPLLAGRVDAARTFAERQVEAGHAAPTFVPSGGQGPDEVCSEAESMGRYLEEHESAPRILLEGRSTTTRENMAFSREVIAADGGTDETPVGFATTNYHVLRGYVFAHDAGLDAEGIAAPTKLYFWPNAFLREFVGMLAAQALSVAVTGLSIVALYVVAEYLLLLT